MMMYYVGAKTEERARRIAKEHGLTDDQWRRAHAGFPSARLRDGIRVDDRKQLIGEFTPEEMWLLTILLPDEER